MTETAPAPCLTPRMTTHFFVSFVVSFAHD